MHNKPKAFGQLGARQRWVLTAERVLQSEDYWLLKI
jgi:hypothetical protein